MTVQVFFPDTNLLMQCRDLKELPWGDIKNVEECVRIVLARTVIQEVDRFKAGGNARRSRRAKRLSSKLFKEILKAGSEPIVIRDSDPRIEVIVPPAGLKIKEIANLDLDIADHRIIAEAIAYTGIEENVRFLSQDTVALLLAAEQGLEWEWIPDKWFLEPEPNPQQKEIKELERRIRQLEGDAPQIEIEISDRPLVIKAKRFSPLPNPLIQDLIEEVTHRYPMQTAWEQKNPGDIHALLSGYRPPTHTAIEIYEENYRKWVNRLENAFEKMVTSLSNEARCTEVKIRVRNLGSTVAREVLIDVCLSKGFLFLHPIDDARKKMGLGSLPPVPPPPKPKTFFDKAQTPLTRYPMINPIMNTNRRRDPNAFYYKPDTPDFESERHTFECEVFRHQESEENFNFLIIAEEEVTSGVIECRISASNLTKPVVARSPIRVEYTDSNAIESVLNAVANFVGKE